VAARSSKKAKPGGPIRPKRHRIPKVVVLENADTLQFSFKHLDLTNEKYPVGTCCATFWEALARRLHEYSAWTVDQFSDQNYAEHRHIIDFSETTETGFSHLDTEQLAYEEPWQFQVGDEGWRVAGFLLNGTFYIVWLDYNHALYGDREPAENI
jgi:hypothetical protein